MADPITAISGASLATSVSARSVRPTDTENFADSLTQMIDKVESTSVEANVAVENMLTGTGDVHEAMIALQEAETALELTVQVRNKLVQAYQEIMRMPV